tara:strand:+ start:2590 stop:3456 length:867 start_codon:yes stop_codon:yes gene_type:complete
MQKMPQLDSHPIADIWPMMPDEDIQSLSNDIRNQGLLAPVWIYEDKILDGRNRAKACQIAGVKVETKTYTGDNPVAFAFSLNEKRRHLSSGARAALAVEAKPLYEAEAKKRQIRKPESVVQKVAQQNTGKSRDKAAADFGTNHQYVNQAEKVKAQAPEVFEKLKQGKVSMQDAMREVRSKPTNPWLKDERQRQGAIEEGQAVIANAERDKNLIQWAERKGLAVRIDRGSLFGNPFILGKDGDRDAICDAYRDHYLPHKPSIQKERPGLKGKVLVCHCYPDRCHGEELI